MRLNLHSDRWGLLNMKMLLVSGYLFLVFESRIDTDYQGFYGLGRERMRKAHINHE